MLYEKCFVRGFLLAATDENPGSILDPGLATKFVNILVPVFEQERITICPTQLGREFYLAVTRGDAPDSWIREYPAQVTSALAAALAQAVGVTVHVGKH